MFPSVRACVLSASEIRMMRGVEWQFAKRQASKLNVALKEVQGCRD